MYPIPTMHGQQHRTDPQAKQDLNSSSTARTTSCIRSSFSPTSQNTLLCAPLSTPSPAPMSLQSWKSSPTGQCTLLRFNTGQALSCGMLAARTTQGRAFVNVPTLVAASGRPNPGNSQSVGVVARPSTAASRARARLGTRDIAGGVSRRRQRQWAFRLRLAQTCLQPHHHLLHQQTFRINPMVILTSWRTEAWLHSPLQEALAHG
jgi:hypothetical protein